MKQLYMLLVLVGLAIQGSAQHYRPFRPGALQQYASRGSDTTYTVRLLRQGAIRSGADSLYAFNRLVARQEPLGSPNCVYALPRYAETLFGSSLRCASPGTRQVVYTFQGLVLQQPYFELTRPQAVALEPRDALGRVVLTRPAAAPAGMVVLSLSATNLPAAIYALWLQPAEGPAQVLKVLKN